MSENHLGDSELDELDDLDLTSLRELAEAGRPGAMYVLGRNLLWHRDGLKDGDEVVPGGPEVPEVAEAFTWLRRAAELGVADARDEHADYVLHRVVLDGRTDLGTACVAWLRDSADQNDADSDDAGSLFWLAEFAYLTGDRATGLGLYQRAAEKGHHAAALHLASLAETGQACGLEGVKADPPPRSAG